MDRKTFWATKPPLPEYQAVTFEHPAFEAPIRLVANQFAPVTLGGYVHTPAAITIKEPDAKSGAAPKLTMAFPRQYVGRQFKQQLARIVTLGSRDPITVAYAVYLGTTDAPQVTWSLYASDASGVQFSGDTVQVSATLENPMRRQAALIYTPEVFTGLALI